MRVSAQRDTFQQYESVGKAAPCRDFHQLAQTLIPGGRGSLHRLLLSCLRLVIRLKSPAEEAQLLSSTPRGKAMFHKTTQSLLKINIH